MPSSVAAVVSGPRGCVGLTGYECRRVESLSNWPAVGFISNACLGDQRQFLFPLFLGMGSESVVSGKHEAKRSEEGWPIISARLICACPLSGSLAVNAGRPARTNPSTSPLTKPELGTFTSPLRGPST